MFNKIIKDHTMIKIVDSQKFQTKNSDGKIFELENGDIIIGFHDPLHTPKINSSSIVSSHTNLDLLPGTTYLVSSNQNTIDIVTYH